MLDLSTRPDQATASACDTRPRLDLYTPIHKALRAFLSDTLVRVGALDARHPKERADTCAQVLALLEQMRRHLSHENAFIHEALERRSPGLCIAIAREHDHHLDSMADLGVLARALRDGDASHADQLALRLYRHLAYFTAENFVHMREEETAVINAPVRRRTGALHDAAGQHPARYDAKLAGHGAQCWNSRSMAACTTAPSVFVAMFDIARTMQPERLAAWPVRGSALADPADSSAARPDRNPRPDTVAPAGQDLQSGGLPCARMPRAQAIHLRSRPQCPSPRSRVLTSIRTWTG
jgi:hypothetical protein